MVSEKASAAFLFITLLSATLGASAKDIYVATSGSDKNAGTSAAAPLATIAAASRLVGPGDNVNLLAGTYKEAIIPVASGKAGSPITYRSSGAGPAVITGVNVGILIGSQSYIVIDGVNVNGVNHPPGATVNTFISIQNSNNITVQHGTFQHANGWAGIDVSGLYGPGNVYFEDVAKSKMVQGSSSYITIQDNTIDDVGNYATPAGDVIQVSFGPVQNILIQRNTITHGGHDLIEFDSDHGIVQDNTLNNSYSDIVGGDTGYRSMEVQGSFNVIQRNVMAHSRLGGGGYVAPVASIRGEQNIVRQNVFQDGITGATDTWCGPQVTTVLGVHIYNNTMYQLGGDGWSAWAYTGCSTAGNFVFANNLVLDSRMTPGTLSGVTHGGTLANVDLTFAVAGGGTGLVNLGLGPTAGTIVKGNLFAPHGGGPAYVLLGGRTLLSAAAAQYPQIFSGNTEQRPTLVTAQPAVLADFQLQANSPGLGAGVPLTSATASGTSDHLVVADSLYFSDGNGLVTGDAIQLQGSNQRATIVSIDRPSNTLVLSSPVTFKSGQGVSLPYNGAAPDVGVGTVGPRPLPPGNFHLGN